MHLAVASAADPHAGGRAAMKEHNVIGTMQLLAACQQAPNLKKLIVRSSTAAYGASFRDPAVFTESTEPRAVPRGGYARDVLDIEGYVRGFRRRRPDVAATVLRFAPFIGENADTTLTRYFSQAIVPTVFGRDPRLQFVHADDALEVLYRAVTGHHPGTFNVAGAGTITLSQAVRRAGRLAFPVLEPAMSALAGFARGLAPREFSLDQLDLFVHGRVVDTSHLVDEFGFEPRSTPAAFADFLRAHASDGPLPSGGHPGGRIRPAVADPAGAGGCHAPVWPPALGPPSRWPAGCPSRRRGVEHGKLQHRSFRRRRSDGRWRPWRILSDAPATSPAGRGPRTRRRGRATDGGRVGPPVVVR